MRPPDTVWQGCLGDWQPLFIREYWLPLGHLAWQEWLAHGPGLVVCRLHTPTATVDWGRAAVPYTACFWPRLEVAVRWDSLGLTDDQRAGAAAAIAAYRPDQDVVLLLLAEDSPPYLACLQGWAVPPPECSRQMGDRAAEFPSTEALG